MDTDLQKTLYDKYPNLFSNKDKSIQESCMGWGIECNRGWYDILNNLCYQINQYEEDVKNEKSSNYNKDYISVKFNQIKQKFGGLRVYFSGGDDYVEGLVAMAESVSYSICEDCGNKGKPNEKGWISTLCESCRSKT